MASFFETQITGTELDDVLAPYRYSVAQRLDRSFGAFLADGRTDRLSYQTLLLSHSMGSAGIGNSDRWLFLTRTDDVMFPPIIATTRRFTDRLRALVKRDGIRFPGHFGRRWVVRSTAPERTRSVFSVEVQAALLASTPPLSVQTEGRTIVVFCHRRRIAEPSAAFVEHATAVATAVLESCAPSD